MGSKKYIIGQCILNLFLNTNFIFDKYLCHFRILVINELFNLNIEVQYFHDNCGWLL